MNQEKKEDILVIFYFNYSSAPQNGRAHLERLSKQTKRENVSLDCIRFVSCALFPGTLANISFSSLSSV